MFVLCLIMAPFWAIDCGQLEILKSFLDKGIDPDITHRSQTLLEYATDLKHIEIIDYLRVVLSNRYCD